VWWKYLLLGTLAYIVGNVAFTIGFFAGLPYSSAPQGSGSAFLYFYAFLTILTCGAIPGLTTAALFYAPLFFVLSRAAKGWESRFDVETRVTAALILLFALGIVFAFGFVVPRLIVMLG
jgi:hypothetical protein